MSCGLYFECSKKTEKNTLFYTRYYHQNTMNLLNKCDIILVIMTVYEYSVPTYRNNAYPFIAQIIVPNFTVGIT